MKWVAPAESSAMGAALRAAKLAGDAVMGVYAEGDPEVETKDDGSPVTAADRASNAAIKAALAVTGRRILSEEGGDAGAGEEGEYTWVVDPLDGTADFVDRTGEFTVMIALVHGGRPVLGVVNWPAGGIVYAAEAGCGAFLRRAAKPWEPVAAPWERMTATTGKSASDPATCRVLGSRHHASDRERKLAGRLGIRKIAGVGSSLKACMIGAGEADACFTYTDKMREWDTAASDCIVSEAGGKMTDMRGAGLEYWCDMAEGTSHRNGVLVTNGTALHERILEKAF